MSQKRSLISGTLIWYLFSAWRRGNKVAVAMLQILIFFKINFNQISWKHKIVTFLISNLIVLSDDNASKCVVQKIIPLS